MIFSLDEKGLDTLREGADELDIRLQKFPVGRAM